MSDGCWDKIEDCSRKCAGVNVCVQYHMKHTGWRGRPLLQCMLCEVSSLAIISTSSQLQLQVWRCRCRWNIHDRTHNGSWMKIQFHDAVIYNIFLFPRFIASSSSPRSAKSWSLQMLLCIQSVELWLIIVAVILSNKH